MITKEQMMHMLDKQEELEIQISGLDWRNAGHNYGLCVHMECAEVIDAIGWKHWKQHEIDEKAVAMELIDIWHFFLAHNLELFDDREATAIDLLDAINSVDFTELRDMHPIECVIGLGYNYLKTGQFAIGNYMMLMAYCGLTWSELYTAYIGKFVLNKFRQDHGYATGDYRKVWSDGREDNEHLLDVLCEEFGEDEERIYDELASRY